MALWFPCFDPQKTFPSICPSTHKPAHRLHQEVPATPHLLLLPQPEMPYPTMPPLCHPSFSLRGNSSKYTSKVTSLKSLSRSHHLLQGKIKLLSPQILSVRNQVRTAGGTTPKRISSNRLSPLLTFCEKKRDTRKRKGEGNQGSLMQIKAALEKQPSATRPMGKNHLHCQQLLPHTHTTHRSGPYTYSETSWGQVPPFGICNPPSASPNSREVLTKYLSCQ